MKTTINRRTLALGAPAALALTVVGGLMPLPAMASSTYVPTNSFSDSLTHFNLFYRLHFIQFAVYAGAYCLSKQVGNAYSVNGILGNAKTATTVWNSLSAEDQLIVRKEVRKAIDIVNFTASDAPKRYFNYVDIALWGNWFNALTADQINTLKQHRAYDFRAVMKFLRFTEGDTGYAAFEAKAVAAQKKHDERFLLWNSNQADTWENVKNGDLATTKITIKLGNLRQPVPRYALKEEYSSFYFFYMGDVTYNQKSVILHGTPSAFEEEVPVQFLNDGKFYDVDSDDYAIVGTQQDSVNYYIAEDLKKNGAFHGRSLEESKLDLERVSNYFLKETGEPYYSYLVAQLALRGAAQATIATVRAALYTKTVDLDLVGQHLKSRFDSTIDSENLGGGRMKNYLAVGIALITSCATASSMLTAMSVVKSREVAKENEGKGLTTSELTAKVKQKMDAAIAALISSSTVSAVALGLLTSVTFSANANASMKVRLLTAGGFGASDLTSGILDILDVFVKKTHTTSLGFAKLCGASARVVGGSYTTLEVFLKLTGWRLTRAGLPSINYPAVQISTATAAFSAFCYLFSIAFI